LAWRLGFTSRDTMALAALLNTRGLVELVVLNIGLERGILPPPLFTMLTLMALLTTAMTSPLLRRLGYTNAVRLSASAPAVASGATARPGQSAQREGWKADTTSAATGAERE
jgi:Kef-type K+ transport system membrane component KefB